jgi:hypothetical protein
MDVLLEEPEDHAPPVRPLGWVRQVIAVLEASQWRECVAGIASSSTFTVMVSPSIS